MTGTLLSELHVLLMPNRHRCIVGITRITVSGYRSIAVAVYADLVACVSSHLSQTVSKRFRTSDVNGTI